MKRLLILTNHRNNRSPGQRFRFEQYISFLEANGYFVECSGLLDPWDDRNFYQSGKYLQKAWILCKMVTRRLKDYLRFKRFDLILVFREAFITGSTFFERSAKLSGAKIVFDLDDSIWISNVSKANKSLAFLKNANKTSKVIELADAVSAGNEYLAAYSRQFNPNVHIIPTTIDTDEYSPTTNYPEKDVVTIGWSGSVTTIQHFQYALPALEILKAKYGSRISISVVGDGNYRNEPLGIIGKPWNKASELDDLRAMDIGLMPLPDDEWARGKCGLKGLQYMALGIPTLMSPVGVNSEIVSEGINGFLPKTTEEWVARISELIEDRSLRERIGMAGRQTVLERYSVLANRDKYLKLYDSLTKR